MKKCNKCGQVSESNMKFCRFCGGNEFSEITEKAENSHKATGKKPIILFVVILFIAVLAICAVLYINKDGGKLKESTPGTSEPPQIEKKLDENQSAEIESESEESVKHSESEIPDKKSNLIENMSPAQRREVNIFLSNFSETDYMRRNTDSTYEKIRFAYYHNLINNTSFSPYSDAVYFGIDESLLDKTLNRFFGESITKSSGDDSQQLRYENGIFKFIPDSSKPSAHFSIVYEMTQNEDGTYSALFDVFDYGETNLKANDVYKLTYDEAEKNYKLRYTGSAILKEKMHNGKKTYELKDYSI